MFNSGNEKRTNGRNEGIDLPNGETIKALDKNEGHKYLGVLECDKLKSGEMKEMLRNEYFRTMNKILKSKLNAGNITEAINSGAVSVIKYGTGIIEWTKQELKEVDRKTRKLLSIYQCFHPRDDVDRLCWKKVEGRRGLQSVEDVVEIEKCSLGHYLTETEEELLKQVKKENIFKDERDPKERKKTITNRRKERFLEKRIHPVFWKGTKEARMKRQHGNGKVKVKGYS